MRPSSRCHWHSLLADEFNNNEKESLPADILKLLRQDGDSSSQISRSLQRQDTSDTEHTVDFNILNDEMRLRNNIENMYKKGGGGHDPLIYSGGETSGLESSFTSPSVQHKDFIEQYLNKLSYLPGDVITNHSEHHPMLSLGTTQIPQINSTSYTSPFLSAAATTTPAAMPLTTSGLNGGVAGIGGGGLHDLLDTKDLLYNSLSSDVLFDAAAGGVTTGGGSNMVDMLDVPGTLHFSQLIFKKQKRIRQIKFTFSVTIKTKTWALIGDWSVWDLSGKTIKTNNFVF